MSLVRIEKFFPLVSYFRGLELERFHCIQSVLLFQRVKIKEFHCIQRCSQYKDLRCPKIIQKCLHNLNLTCDA